MDILILGFGTPKASPAYRGTDRVIPHHVDSLGEEHPVNQAFRWYCEEGGEFGLVHDLARARELVRAYKKLQPSQHFEMIEVSSQRHYQPTGMFLGFDLSAGYNSSLLSWGLDLSNVKPSEPIIDEKYILIQPLVRLIQEFFQKRLNSNGLFDDYEDASFCLSCMMALQRIYPDLWENEEVTFEIVGLWRLVV
jgi:hypothetical protein